MTSSLKRYAPISEGGDHKLLVSFPLPPSPLQEEEQMIAEWQPEPLVPDIYPKDREVDPAPVVTG